MSDSRSMMKRMIARNWTALNTIKMTDIHGPLIEKEVITISFWEELQGINTEKQRTEKFLHELQRRSFADFEKFIEVLKQYKHYIHVAERLENTTDRDESDFQTSTTRRVTYLEDQLSELKRNMYDKEKEKEEDAVRRLYEIETLKKGQIELQLKYESKEKEMSKKDTEIKSLEGKLEELHCLLQKEKTVRESKEQTVEVKQDYINRMSTLNHAELTNKDREIEHQQERVTCMEKERAEKDKLIEKQTKENDTLKEEISALRIAYNAQTQNLDLFERSATRL